MLSPEMEALVDTVCSSPSALLAQTGGLGTHSATASLGRAGVNGYGTVLGLAEAGDRGGLQHCPASGQGQASMNNHSILSLPC